MDLVLASASPRRRDLLAQMGVNFSCDPADIDETVKVGEAATDYVERMAKEKATKVMSKYAGQGVAVLAADTIVVVDEIDILGKPVDRFDALAMLARLSGRSHSVMTALKLIHPKGEHSERVETQVQFINLTQALCDAYLATDEPWDKAGAYAIQGLAGVFIKGINGSYSNVVGLPLAETWGLLNRIGVATAIADVAGD
ncbi:MAG: Maf family protein [Pseudomonadota bacterium]